MPSLAATAAHAQVRRARAAMDIHLRHISCSPPDTFMPSASTSPRPPRRQLRQLRLRQASVFRFACARLCLPLLLVASSLARVGARGLHELAERARLLGELVAQLGRAVALANGGGLVGEDDRVDVQRLPEDCGDRELDLGAGVIEVHEQAA